MNMEVLNNWISAHQNEFLRSNVLIDLNKNEGLNKHTVVFSFKNKMASIELLKNGTMDFTVIHSETEKIIFTETFNNLNEQSLLSNLDAFYKKIIEGTFDRM